MKTTSSRLWTSCLLLAALGCAPEPTATSQTPVDIDPQKAVAGVGIGGQKLADHSQADKIISGPISALQHIKQLAPLEIQIPHALNLYQGMHGRKPRNHAEFMAEIITANQIQLPELPPGVVYHYNKEAGELWVYNEAEVPQD